MKWTDLNENCSEKTARKWLENWLENYFWFGEQRTKLIQFAFLQTGHFPGSLLRVLEYLELSFTKIVNFRFISLPVRIPNRDPKTLTQEKSRTNSGRKNFHRFPVRLSQLPVSYFTSGLVDTDIVSEFGLLWLEDDLRMSHPLNDRPGQSKT